MKVDVCVIGAGSGGLTVAAGAAQMGATVALVERGAMGGDCLNTGCVPSKAMLAAAQKAQAIREGEAFGIKSDEPGIDWEAVHLHVQEVIAAIAPNDSQERFEKLGVRVIRAPGRFLDRQTLEAGEVRIRAKYFVLATGSSPFVPEVPGLDRVPYFTNETIFSSQQPIEHLIVIGGGPIGLEMAQAHCRLGSKVTVLEAARCLPKDDPQLAAVVLARLRDEGVGIHESVQGLKVESGKKGICIRYLGSEGECAVSGTHLLMATGRRANVGSLNLEAAGVDYSPHGVLVDARLRSSNRRIFAVGDVAGPFQFTHMAAYQAGIVIRNMLFRLPAKVDYRAIPWVTYTDPELAQAGLTEAEAKAKGEVHVLCWEFADNDRAQAERRTEGRLKVICTPKGKVLGASIVGLHAGELIQPWVLAISQQMKIGAMASMIAPYPTLSEASKRVAGSFYTEKLFSPAIRRIVRFLMRF